jgi:hypothetical protein
MRVPQLGRRKPAAALHIGILLRRQAAQIIAAECSIGDRASTHPAGRSTGCARSARTGPACRTPATAGGLVKLPVAPPQPTNVGRVAVPVGIRRPADRVAVNRDGVERLADPLVQPGGAEGVLAPQQQRQRLQGCPRAVRVGAEHVDRQRRTEVDDVPDSQMPSASRRKSSGSSIFFSSRNARSLVRFGNDGFAFAHCLRSSSRHPGRRRTRRTTCRPTGPRAPPCAACVNASPLTSGPGGVPAHRISGLSLVFVVGARFASARP